MRPVLRDLLRPRPVHPRRPARLARRGRRPVRRDLEPGVHAVRGRPARHARRAAAALDRHRHGAGALRRDPAGQARQLRHRHLPRADPGQRRGHRPGPGRPVPGQPPRGRRPSAQRGVPDRRRRAAVERRPRLRAAPDHAPRDAPRAHDGRARAADVPAGAGAGAPDGRRLPGTGARRGADRRDAAAGGDAVPPDAGARPAPAHRGDRTARRPPAAARRGGVPAVRHLRLPARPDAGRAARAGARGGPRRLRGGDGGAARPRPRRLGRLRRGRHRARLVRAEGEGRRVGVPRLFDRDGGGGDRRAGGERRTGRSPRPPAPRSRWC